MLYDNELDNHAGACKDKPHLLLTKMTTSIGAHYGAVKQANSAHSCSSILASCIAVRRRMAQIATADDEYFPICCSSAVFKQHVHLAEYNKLISRMWNCKPVTAEKQIKAEERLYANPCLALTLKA